MLLDVSKIKSLGWKPKLNSKQAIRQAIEARATENQSKLLRQTSTAEQDVKTWLEG